MNARMPLFWIALGGVVAAGAAAPPSEDLAARAARVHREAIVVDTHEDVPEALEEKWGAFANWHDLAEPGATKHLDITRARQGGLTAPFFAVYVPARYAETGGSARYALELSDMVDGIVARHPADLMAAASVEDIRRAKREGRIGVEGDRGRPRHRGLDGRAARPYRLGIRYMTSPIPTPTTGGLGGQLRPRLRPRYLSGPPWPERLWPRGRPRDEPAGHDGGRLPRLGGHGGRRAGDVARARLRVPPHAGRSRTCHATSPTTRSSASRPRAAWS
jgi:hypothetical protein